MMKTSQNHRLIVTIVKKGHSKSIIEAAKNAGVRGRTIIYSRGVGTDEKKNILGIYIEPEKEVIFILIHKNKSDDVFEAIMDAGNINKPGKCIGFVLDVEKVVGLQ